jgi:putative ABC transport system permease protein
MSIWRLVKNSLFFYWPTSVGVFLCVVLSAGVLTGALLVGDSVRASLARLVELRLGRTQVAMFAGDKFFRSDLAAEIEETLQSKISAVLWLSGMVVSGDGKNRVNRVEVLGVDKTFFGLAAAEPPVKENWTEGVVLNSALAERLDVTIGDEIVLRLSTPSLMPREAVLGSSSDLSAAYRIVIKAIAGQQQFGRFSLRSNQVSPMNVFVPIDWLAERINRTGRANLLLAAGGRKKVAAEDAQAALKKSLRIEDLSLELRELKGAGGLELRSSRVFIEERIADAAKAADESAKGVLTYFVNEIRAGEKSCPYSMVAAIEVLDDETQIIPSCMKDEQIIINEWLADDLGLEEQDEVTLKYYVIGPGGKLIERQSNFQVFGVVAMMPPAVDSSLMPDFEGISGQENCRDWEAGIPIDLQKIREKDEEYWDKYGGAPKAFITLNAGRRIWENRFGNLTAVRYGADAASKQTIAAEILRRVEPASVGLYFQDVRRLGEKGSAEGTDFGGLFLGLSFFLIAAAVMLMLVVFVFGVERRSAQAGIFMALGLSRPLIRRIFLLEGVVLAVGGSVVGALAGTVYTRLMILGLSTVWRGAVSGSQIQFYARPSTIFIGVLCAALVSLGGVLLGLRMRLRRHPRQLLSGVGENEFLSASLKSKGRAGLLLAGSAMSGAVVLLILNGMGTIKSVAGVFFGVGTLFLLAEIGAVHTLLCNISKRLKGMAGTLAGLGIQNNARRLGRSLAVVGIFACGCFMIVAVGANRKGSVVAWEESKSGTGGFALMGETSIAVLKDLNSQEGRRSIGLSGGAMESVRVVRLRVHDGDDASCLNLNRAQRPRLLGVDSGELDTHGCFSFKKARNEIKSNWRLLDDRPGDDIVPAIGDYATVYWGLGKTIGDEIEYEDGTGRKFRLRIVAIIEDSILQGSLLISEDHFIGRFPADEGYRLFLVDADGPDKENVKQALSAGLRDFGVEFVPTDEKLAEFNTVQNTYLSIFALLGALGLMLGGVGLGLVVLLNVLERRGELAMMRAVGFARAELTKMIFYEHTSLMLCGLIFGVVAGTLSVWPVIAAAAADVPYVFLGCMVAAIAVSGFLWIWLASVFALRGNVLQALRQE